MELDNKLLLSFDGDEHAIKNSIRKRIESHKQEEKEHQYLRLKIGFSHEIVYKSEVPKTIQTSRYESRTKGTLLSLKSKNY